MAGSFELIFEGFAEGVTLATIQEKLQELNIDPALIANSQGQPVTLLKDLPDKTAIKYQKALQAQGILCKLELITSMHLSLELLDEEMPADNAPVDFLSKIDESSSTETFFPQVTATTPAPATKPRPQKPEKEEDTDTEALPTIQAELIQPAKPVTPPPPLVSPPPTSKLTTPKPATPQSDASPATQNTAPPAPALKPPKSANDPPSIPPSEMMNEAIVLESAKYEAPPEMPAIPLPKYSKYDDGNDDIPDTPPSQRHKKPAANRPSPLLLGASAIVVLFIGAGGAFFFLQEEPAPTSTPYTTRTATNTLTPQQTTAPDNTQKLIASATIEINNKQYEAAINIIKTIKSVIERDKLLQIIADQQLAASQLGDAIATAKQMSSGPTQANLLSQLVDQYIAIQNFDRAKELAKLITGYTLQTATLSKITIAETTTLSTSAREQAQAGQKNEAMKTFAQATQYATNINDLDSRISAFSVIAIEQTRANYLEQAEETITYIEKVDHRAKTLSTMAGIIAHNGDKETAQQFFKRAVQDANRIWDAREKSALIEHIAKEREAAGIGNN